MKVMERLKEIQAAALHHLNYCADFIDQDFRDSDPYIRISLHTASKTLHYQIKLINHRINLVQVGLGEYGIGYKTVLKTFNSLSIREYLKNIKKAN